MKKFFILIIIFSAPLFPLKGEGLKRGVDIVVEAIDTYASGEANDFLREIDAEYLERRASHGLDWQIDKRKLLSETAEAAPGKDPYKEALEKLTERRNYAIGKVIAHNDDPLSRGLRESIGFKLGVRERDALSAMQKLHMKFLGQGDTPLENGLIEIDLEYDMKKQLLDTRYSTSKSIDMDAYQKQQLYLEIDKFERMLALCKEHKEEALAQKTTTALKVLPKRLATQFDEGNLRALGSETYEPQSDVEKELQAIVKQYELDKERLKSHYFQTGEHS